VVEVDPPEHLDRRAHVTEHVALHRDIGLDRHRAAAEGRGDRLRRPAVSVDDDH
jgi:hypothetical protein